jgi:anti-sigma-K factor RskA
MNVKEYIASGLLEAYVLGGLDPQEIPEVEKMAAQHPEIRKEILSLQRAFESYAESVAVRPRPELKNKILYKLPPAPVLGSDRESTQKLSYYKYATAASIALMIVCGSLAGYFWSKWKGAEERLVTLEEQSNRYADQINKANYKINQMAENFDVLLDTAVVKVTMKGVENYPASLAMVFWNKNTREVFIDPGNLPQAPEGMQYQLWALKDGQPIDAGVFETDRSAGLQKVRSIEGAQAYAVTLEKRGGSKVPTLAAMYVFGNV